MKFSLVSHCAAFGQLFLELTPNCGYYKNICSDFQVTGELSKAAVYATNLADRYGRPTASHNGQREKSAYLTIAVDAAI